MTFIDISVKNGRKHKTPKSDVCDTEIRLNHLWKIESERVFNQSCCLFANCSQMETYLKWPSSMYPTQFWTVRGFFSIHSSGFPRKWGVVCQPSDILCIRTLTPAKYLAIFRSINHFWFLWNWNIFEILSKVNVVYVRATTESRLLLEFFLWKRMFKKHSLKIVNIILTYTHINWRRALSLSTFHNTKKPQTYHKFVSFLVRQVNTIQNI